VDIVINSCLEDTDAGGQFGKLEHT